MAGVVLETHRVQLAPQVLEAQAPQVGRQRVCPRRVRAEMAETGTAVEEMGTEEEAGVVMVVEMEVMELREMRPGRGQLPLSSGSFWAFWRSLQVQVQPIGIIVGAVWLLRPHLRLWMAMTAIVLLTRSP